MPDSTGEIKVVVEGEKRELRYNSNHRRIFGLTDWYEKINAKPRDFVEVNKTQDGYEISFLKEEKFDKIEIQEKEQNGLSDKAEEDLEDAKNVKEAAEAGETVPEINEEVKKQEVNFKELIRSVDIGRLNKFKPHSLENPRRIKVNTILSDISECKWVLPHFQRYFDWNKNDVKEFWESIFKDYYVGSFLLWETDRDPKLGIQPIDGVIKKGDEIKPNFIILDGQQRITSLHYAIKVPPKIYLKGIKFPLYYYVNFNKYLNSDTKKDVIEFRTEKIKEEESFKRMLFPLYQLEKYDEWVDGLEDYMHSQSKDQDYVNKLRAIRKIIQMKLRHMYEFEIPYIELPKSMELFQVTDIFENINTKGKSLSVFDLLIARLYKYDINLKKLWDVTKNKYPKIERYSDRIPKTQIYILQAMSILYEKNNSAKRADVLDIYEKIYEKPERDFEKDWNNTSNYMNKAIEKIENMRDGFGVKDEKELPFAPVIPVLTALLKTIDEKGKKPEFYVKVSRWYWSAVFTNAYSEAADSQMTDDFRELKKWFEKEDEKPKTVKELEKKISNEDLDFIEIQTKSNAKYKGVMSLIALKGARDFNTSQMLENARKNDKDHIFPRSFNFGFGSNKYVHSVLNMTWMSEETNKKIKGCKNPSKYVPEFRQRFRGTDNEFAGMLKTHFINEKAMEYLIQDKFTEFIDERQKSIISKIKNLIGIEKLKTKTFISPEKPYTNNVAFTNILKSCNEHIYWVDKYFSKKGFEFLAELDGKNINKIKLIMSIDKVDDNFRKLYKDFQKEMENDGIKCELRVIVNAKIKSGIHDRFIVTKYKAYNIPSPDTIARGQLSEISESRNKEQLHEEFNKLWSSSKDIIHDWNYIKEIQSDSN